MGQFRGARAAEETSHKNTITVDWLGAVVGIVSGMVVFAI
jgi:hypothetical protein